MVFSTCIQSGRAIKPARLPMLIPIPEPVTFFAFLFPNGTSLKCKSFTIVWARCVLFGSSPAFATAQPLPGPLSHGSHAAQPTYMIFRWAKKITADLLAADAREPNALRLFHFYERCKKIIEHSEHFDSRIHFSHRS
jgi:hypothetical protein